MYRICLCAKLTKLYTYNTYRQTSFRNKCSSWLETNAMHQNQNPQIGCDRNLAFPGTVAAPEVHIGQYIQTS